jgi:hypothetical protein
VSEEAGGLYHLLQTPISVLPLNFINFNFSSSKINNAVTSLASTSFFVESVNTSLWHFRLSHPSDIPLKMLSPVIPSSTGYLFLIAHMFLNNLSI